MMPPDVCPLSLLNKKKRNKENKKNKIFFREFFIF